MGCFGNGVKWMLLPQEDQGEGQVGSTARRRQAQMCYRLMVVGGILAFAILGLTWYKLMKTSKPKDNLHNLLQDKLQQEANKEWHEDWQDNKDDAWSWDWDEYDDYDGDMFDGSGWDDNDTSSGDYTDSRADYDDSRVEDGSDEYDDDYWYADDYKHHTEVLEDSPAWSLDEQWDIDIRELSPGEAMESTLENYKNPCWTESIDFDSPYTDNFYIKEKPQLASFFEDLFKKIGQRHWRMRCLPYFYVFDGPEAEFETKDSFWKSFSLHPYIARPPVLRPQFWNKRLLENNTSIRDYLDLFDKSAAEIRASYTSLEDPDMKVAHAKIVGEESGSYLYSMDSWKKLDANIEEGKYADSFQDEPAYITADLLVTQTPDSKLVIMLRNPVKRIAEYYYRVLNPGASTTEFQEDVIQSTSILNQCLQARTRRACLYDGDLNKKMKIPLRIALYSTFVADWAARFSPEDMKFIIYEEYRKYPVKTLNSVYKFLGLGHVAPDQFTLLKKQWYETAQDNKTYIWPMLNETRKTLMDFYEPYNAELAQMLDRDELTTIWNVALDPDELRQLNRKVAKPVFKKRTKSTDKPAENGAPIQQEPNIAPTKSVAAPMQESNQAQYQPPVPINNPIVEQPPVNNNPIIEQPPVNNNPIIEQPPVNNNPIAEQQPINNNPIVQQPPAYNNAPASPPIEENHNVEQPRQGNYNEPENKPEYRAPAPAAPVDQPEYRAPAPVDQPEYRAPAPVDQPEYRAPAPVDQPEYRAPAPAVPKSQDWSQGASQNAAAQEVAPPEVKVPAYIPSQEDANLPSQKLQTNTNDVMYKAAEEVKTPAQVKPSYVPPQAPRSDTQYQPGSVQQEPYQQELPVDQNRT